MIAAIHVAVKRIEVKRDDVTAADWHVENCGAAQKMFFAPGRAPAGNAGGDAPGERATPPHDAACESEHRTASQGYQQTAVVPEALYFHEACVTDTAGDVVGLGWRAEAGGLRRFLEGHRAPTFGQALNLLSEFKIDVAIEKHIKVVPKITGANVFVANIRIGNAVLIEDVADPADGVGVSPGHPNADARNARSVMRNDGRSRKIGRASCRERV